MDRRPRSKLLLYITFLIVLVAAISLYNSVRYRHLYSFKSDFKNKYSNIEEIRFKRIGPGLNINIYMSGEIKFDEVSAIFNDLIEQPPEVIEDIWDKYDGFEKLSINFCTNDEHGTYAYKFHEIEHEKGVLSFNRYKSWEIEDYILETRKTFIMQE